MSPYRFSDACPCGARHQKATPTLPRIHAQHRPASASIGDLENIGISIGEDEEEYNTLAGFMLSKLQRIPRGGEFVVYNNIRYTIVDVEQNRIMKVKIEPLDAQAQKQAKA